MNHVTEKPTTSRTIILVRRNHIKKTEALSNPGPYCQLGHKVLRA